MSGNNNKNNLGFTIIEVLIVLAIAGLILLIVFLAVPALQRNSRNNTRKQEAARIAAAIEDFVATNGYLPGMENGTSFDQSKWLNGTVGDCPTIEGNAGNLTIFGLPCSTNGFIQYNPSSFTARYSSSTYVTNPFPSDFINMIEGTQCAASQPSATTTSGVAASIKQASLIYSLETASGNSYQQCISI